MSKPAAQPGVTAEVVAAARAYETARAALGRAKADTLREAQAGFDRALRALCRIMAGEGLDYLNLDGWRYVPSSDGQDMMRIKLIGSKH